MPNKYSKHVQLSWSKHDVEERLGVRGGRYTHTNLILSFILGLLLTAGFYGVIFPYRSNGIIKMFTDRGAVQYVTMLFTFWALLILIIKSQKIRNQRKALQINFLPDDPAFILSAGTAHEVLERMHNNCDNPKYYFLLNRIELGLSNLKNIGRVADLNDLFQSQADNDEDTIESSYGLLKGLVWAIPVLGFIGTVQGLSQAIGQFGSVLTDNAEMSNIKPALQGVTAGLATAFETTLVALVAALAIQLLITFVRGSEESLLDDCKEFCQRRIVGRVRLSDLERGN